MKLNGDTIKDFFVNHVEKIGFAVALGLVGLFVYNGIKLKGYERTPVELRNNAEQATTRIGSYEWNAKLEAEELDPKRDFSKEVRETTLDVNAAGYATRVPFVPVPNLPMVKRSDPELFPPINLEVDVAFGPLPIQGIADPLASLEAAPKPEPKVIRKRAPRKKKRDNDSSPMGMEGMMGGMEGSGAEEGAEDDRGFEGMGMDMGGESGATAEGPFAGTGGRKFPNPPKYWNKASSAGGGMMTMAPTNNTNVGVVGRMVVAVKGLVRYQDQFDEFEKTLQDAKYYRPQYDRPDYLSFIVERAEVGDDPNAPLDWKPLSNLPQAFNELQKYPGRGRELVDPNYTIPNVLTMEAPPILIRDVDRFGIHSEIPLVHEKPVSTTPDLPKEEEDPTGPINDPLLPTRPNQMAGMGGESGMGMGMGMDMDGSGEGESEGAMGMEMGGEGMDGGGAVVNRYPMTKYKMIRFYDTKALPGKKYRYRFQVIISDPNHPKDEDLNVRILDPDVLKRLADVKKQEEANGGRRIFYRFSPWSDPSPVISTPSVERVLAGPGMPIAKSKTYNTPTGGKVYFVPPTTRVSSVLWGGRALPTDVSYTTDATFGTVMNTKSDLKIIHPATLELKLAKDHSFRSNNVVVDMTVAEALTDERENPQVAPTMVAVADAKGNIIVRDELADLEQFRIYAFVDDEPPPVIEGGGGAMEDEGDGEMEGMGFNFGEDEE